MTSVARPTGSSPVSDHEPRLFSLVRAGDQQAFRALYEMHKTPVYWAAFAVLRSRPDTEEIVTDTFMTLWTKRNSIQLVGQSTLPWLITTGRYLARNRLRAVQRRPIDPIEEGKELADTSPTPENAALAREATRGIETMIQAMPDTDREIFRLCLIEDLSYKEAATRLGLTHGSVRNRLSRLKNRLRSELILLKRGQ